MKRNLMILLLLSIYLGIAAQNIWINEFHYDNASIDADEFIEIVFQMQPGDILADYSVHLYNGNNGSEYSDFSLDTFTAGAVVDGYSFFSLLIEGIQNGEPDGIALAYNGSLIQFLSYEGSFTASGGPADGQTSVDIEVEEAPTTEVGMSLQLSGNGAQYSHFSWMDPVASTMGQINTGQTFGGAPDPSITVSSPNGGEEWEQGSTHMITWNSVSYEDNVTIVLNETWASRVTLADDIENSGSWEWVIPADQTIHSNYSVTVSGIDEEGPGDISDATFSIIEPIQASEYTIYEIQFTEDASGDSPHIDELATTSGVITAMFESTFFIQEGNGAWNGICVYPSGFDISALAVGNEIEITAMVAEYNGKSELIDIVSIDVTNPTAELPVPVVVETGAISMPDFYNPESLEGVLVQMENVFVTNTDLGYGAWEIDDGLDNSAPCIVGAAGVYTYEPVLEDLFASITGVVDYGFGDFKLEPRTDADLLTNGIEISPTVLEFLTYQDCADGKEFVISNTGTSELIINNITIDAEFSGAVAEITTELEYPVTIAPEGSQTVLVIVGLTTRDIEEGIISIDTSVGIYEVALQYNDELNSDTEENEMNLQLISISNYPNPFNPTTTISYNLPDNAENAVIEIYNAKGQNIFQFNLDRNSDFVTWNGTDQKGEAVTSGIYFYKLSSDGLKSITKKMILLK